MIREGTVAQVENLEKVILGMDNILMHDGSRSKEKLFTDQTDSEVYYKLYEVYEQPTGLELGKLLFTRSGIVRLWFDHRDGSALVEMHDRDYGNLWGIKPFRQAVEAVKRNGK